MARKLNLSLQSRQQTRDDGEWLLIEDTACAQWWMAAHEDTLVEVRR